jgi:tetratricopeptide (TPR) repeat protein
MRARAGLARCLWEKGQQDEALAHYRDMLRLNPTDNQGIRFVLASCLLELGHDEELAALINRFEDDASAEIVWTRALLSFRRQGDTADSRRYLSMALEYNPHIPAYLFGHKKIPSRLPDLIGLGDESEAICYSAENLEAWRATAGALAWVAKSFDAEGR